MWPMSLPWPSGGSKTPESAARPLGSVLLLKPGGSIDLFADALLPAWPNAIQHLDGPLIDLGLLEIEHEPIAAPQFHLNAQRSQLCDRLLRLATTLREDLVTPLPPSHAFNPGRGR